MGVSLQGKLVVAISSRALFDFEEENRVFEQTDDRAYMNFPGGIVLSNQRAIDQIKNAEIAMQNANNVQAEALQQEVNSWNQKAEDLQDAAAQYNYQLKIEQEQRDALQQDIYKMYNNPTTTQDELNDAYQMDRTGL